MFQFTHPIYLLLFIPVGVLLWRTAKSSLADITGFRRALSLAFRILILSAVILAASGFQFVRTSKQLAVVFALDISDSLPKDKIQAGLDYVNEALKSMKATDHAGIVVFGSDSSVELAPSRAAKSINKIYSVPTTSYTDIAQALGLAMASFPEGAAKRVVLLTDGNENLGKALDQAYLARSNDIVIDVVPLSNKLEQEALLDKLVVPAEVKIGEPFELKLIAFSEQETAASIKLMRNDEAVGEKVVALSPGKNVLTFTQSIPKAGSYKFEALLEAQADSMTENNRALATTMVRGKPKVLYVEGKPEQGTHLKAALSAQNIDVEARGPDGIPSDLTELANYDSLIISDVSALAMSPQQMKMIQSGVRDLGIGFGMIGGEDSFGAGGYLDTPIEETLPVEMSVRKQKIFPSMTVYIIIDKSGSMSTREDGIEKIRLAAEAAIAVTETLQHNDRIGVIATDTEPKTVSPIRPASMKDAIITDVSALRAGGIGIYCYSSLRRAEEDLQKVTTRIKHVIMLADGSDAKEQDGCLELARKMFRNKITISAVAIGGGPDVPFLQRLAQVGGGGFYLTERARDLPRIFTKDALLASKSLIVEEPFRTKVEPGAEVLQGIDWRSQPPLLGYVTTAPKGMADTLLKSHKDDPIYAQWRYGLGRSIAFTSDAKPMWAAQWVGWSEFSRFWAQAVRWSMKKSVKTDFQTTLDIERGSGRVTVDAVTEKGEFLNNLRLSTTVVMPDMQSRKLELSQTAPGRYEADFQARQVGTYVVNIVQDLEDGATATQTSATVIPYPPEYKDVRPNTFLLNQLARTTGGQMGPEPPQVFRHTSRGAKIPSDLWQILVFAVAFLLPLDVAIRRLNMTWLDVTAVLGAVRSRVLPKREHGAKSIEQVEMLGQLKSSQRVRKERTQVEPVEVIKGDAPTAPQSELPPQSIQSPAAQLEPEQKPVSEEEERPTSRLLKAKQRAKRNST